MPCSCEGYPTEPSDYETIKGTLCAALTLLEKEGYSIADLDAKEAGVSHLKMRHWWEKHQEEDKRRKAREAAEQKREAARLNALSKLTPQEREVLGVK